ncbi:MAG TPA: hypothetical protein VLA19_24325 [Herpetosiphonaceae bacterium]|nr:hypothetical protein [Herpetosiphonaceae bacterium]
MKGDAAQQIDDGAGAPGAPTEERSGLDVVFALIQGRLAEQRAHISTLDSKANFGLGSATLLIAGAANLRNALAITQQAGQARGDISFVGLTVDPIVAANGLTVAALLTYGVVILATFQAYTLRRYSVAPEPAPLLEHYLNAPADYVKERVARTMADSYAKNERLVRGKVRWTKMALGGLVIEAVWLLLMAALQFSL